MKKIKSRNEQQKTKWARKLDFHNCFEIKKSRIWLNVASVDYMLVEQVEIFGL